MEQSTFQTSSSPQPTLLTLPFQIRHKIYNLLAQQPPNTHALLTNPTNDPQPPTIPFPVLAGETWWGYDYATYCPTHFGPLRATCRQLLRETVQFISFPPIWLQFNAEPKVGSEMAHVVTREQDTVCCSDVVAVLLMYSCCPKTFYPCPHSPKEPLEEAYSVDTASFHAAVAACVKQFPFLRSIAIATDHGDLSEMFQDPAEALEVLKPFLERTMQVTLHASSPSQKWGKEYKPCEKIENALEEGRSEILLFSKPGEPKWGTLYLR